jgi:hypothetical protein
MYLDEAAVIHPGCDHSLHLTLGECPASQRHCDVQVRRSRGRRARVPVAVMEAFKLGGQRLRRLRLRRRHQHPPQPACRLPAQEWYGLTRHAVPSEARGFAAVEASSA